MHEVYLRRLIEHAQTSCGMWSNPIGPSTRKHVYKSVTRLFVWGGAGWVCSSAQLEKGGVKGARQLVGGAQVLRMRICTQTARG